MNTTSILNDTHNWKTFDHPTDSDSVHTAITHSSNSNTTEPRHAQAVCRDPLQSHPASSKPFPLLPRCGKRQRYVTTLSCWSRVTAWNPLHMHLDKLFRHNQHFWDNLHCHEGVSQLYFTFYLYYQLCCLD